MTPVAEDAKTSDKLRRVIVLLLCAGTHIDSFVVNRDFYFIQALNIVNRFSKIFWKQYQKDREIITLKKDGKWQICLIDLLISILRRRFFYFANAFRLNER